MRIVTISDTHGYHHQVKVPDGDVLVHAGDCTAEIGQASTRFFLQWFEEQPHKHKVFIAGNHDGQFQKWPKQAKEMVKTIAPSCIYLQDSSIEIDGIKLYGSPWTPTFFDWYFMANRGEDIKKKWDGIPECDVLITHGPPHGILDLSNNLNVKTGKKFDDHLGCEELRKAVERIRPKLHVFGHIHGSGGNWWQIKDAACLDTIFINASVMDETYRPVHKAQIFEI
jgi:Icc-related predicted phosphoesterase